MVKNVLFFPQYSNFRSEFKILTFFYSKVKFLNISDLIRLFFIIVTFLRIKFDFLRKRLLKIKNK